MRVVLINYEETLLSAYIGFLGTLPDITIVAAFRDEEEALFNMQALEPQIALIDLDKRGKCETDVVRNLRSDYPELVIIAISVNDTDKFRGEVMQSGANVFVPKSRVIHDLVPIMRSVASFEIGAGQRN